MKNYQISKTHYKVGDFISWAKNNNLILSPSFQRRAVWPLGAKSFLIDTIIRGLPIPIIFLRDQKTDLESFEPKREVVDGQQRIRTLLAFVAPQLLKDYKEDRDKFTMKASHNKELAGKTFKELPPDVAQNILDYQFSVHILPSNVDDREVLQIFARMNATGVKLNQQELRNAAYFGELKTSMYSISAEQLHRWRDWRLFSESQISRMAEVEITSEFIRHMVSGLSGKTQAALDKLYSAYEETWLERSEAERRFRHVMEEINSHIGDDIANSIFNNRVAFYGLFIAVYDYIYNEMPLSRKIREQKLPDSFRSNILKASASVADKKAPEKVLDALARRTTHKDSRKTVISYLLTSISS